MPGGPATAPLTVEVRPLTYVRTRALPLGRAQVTIVLFHPRDLRWDGSHVRWWFASGRSGYQAAQATTSYRLSPHAAVLRTSASPDTGHFQPPAWSRRCC
ncbi:MAG: hypothetical protein ACYC91_01700 [Solirubrobacteraceae bacterium]